MTSDVVILVPRREDRGHRDRLWRLARAKWAELFPGWPIVEGHHTSGPFNRSAAINQASDLAGAWQIAVVIDSDVLPDPSGIEAAVQVARTGRPASGFDHRRNLDRRGTSLILAGYRGNWDRYVGSVHKLCHSGAFALSRDLWEAVGGFDELFVGWGFEDTAFEIACETVSGQDLYLAPTMLWHLWHPVSREHNRRLPGFQSNLERRDRYIAAHRDPAALALLLDEARRR